MKRVDNRQYKLTQIRAKRNFIKSKRKIKAKLGKRRSALMLIAFTFTFALAVQARTVIFSRFMPWIQCLIYPQA